MHVNHWRVDTVIEDLASDKLTQLYWEKVSHTVITEDSDTLSISYTVHDPQSSRVHDEKRSYHEFLVLHFRPATSDRLLAVRTDSFLQDYLVSI